MKRGALATAKHGECQTTIATLSVRNVRYSRTPIVRHTGCCPNLGHSRRSQPLVRMQGQTNSVRRILYPEQTHSVRQQLT